MFCINCGEEILEDSIFCPSCGVSISDAEPESEQVQGYQQTSILMHEDSSAQYSNHYNASNPNSTTGYAESFVPASQSYQAFNEEDTKASSGKRKTIIICITAIFAAIVIGIGVFFVWKKLDDQKEQKSLSEDTAEQEKVESDNEDTENTNEETETESTEPMIYVFPAKQDNVSIKYHQMDISNYPTIQIYYQMDTLDGSVIDTIQVQNFGVLERVDGESVARDVKLAGTVEANSFVSVDLVLDTGSGINDSQLSIIKNGLSKFVDKLQSKNGNRAEILQTNTSIYEAAAFTSDMSAIKKGIDQLGIYGGMAIYDALLGAINRTAMQAGSKYVVALTCGRDASSMVANKESVINAANLYQIPIYIVGFGDYLDENSLREITEKTGGTYQHISELSSLSDIYEQIYMKHLNLYMLEFTTDSAIEKLVGRELTIDFQQENLDGMLVQNIMPQATSSNNGGVEVRDITEVANIPSPTTTAPTAITPSPNTSQLIEDAFVSYAYAFIDGVNAKDFSYVSWTLIPDSPIYKDQKRYIDNAEGLTEKLLYCEITEMSQINSETYSITTIEDYEITNQTSGFFTASFKTKYTVKLYQGEWKMYSLDTLERL